MTEMEELRKRIDRANDTIVRKIAERKQIAEQIAAVKKRKGLPLRDPDREAAVLRQARLLAQRYGLDQDQIEGIFVKIIELCLKAERKKAAE